MILPKRNQLRIVELRVPGPRQPHHGPTGHLIEWQAGIDHQDARARLLCRRGRHGNFGGAHRHERQVHDDDQLPHEVVDAAVARFHREYDGRPIREFIPLLVERQVREHLSGSIPAQRRSASDVHSHSPVGVADEE